MNIQPFLRVCNLSIINPQQKTLVRDVSFELLPGEILLLTGGSGSGKTTLLKLLAGLLPVEKEGWQVSGSLVIDRKVYDISQASEVVHGGYVFQDYAMFDDLTPRDNVAIARDHAKARIDLDDATMASLVATVSPEGQTFYCSGGEKQRIAITRTLFAGHKVLFYDEPNAGLDIEQTRQFVDLVQEVVRQTQQPAIIVAHHFRDLLPIVDQVLVIDQAEQCVHKFSPEYEPIAARLRQPQEHQEPARVSVPPEWRLRTSASAWGVRYLARYIVTLLYSPTMLLYMMLGGLLTGFVSTWFLFQHFPYREFLNPVLHDKTLQALGFVQFRVLVPLLTTLLIAARNSALISADLGHRMHTSQIAAMHNLRIPYQWYLHGGIILSMVLSSVFFVTVNFALCAWASMGTWQLLYPMQSVATWKAAFYHDVLLQGVTGPAWVLGKTVVSGILIAVVSIWAGMAKKSSVVDLNKGIARAIVAATSAVLMIHALSAFMEF